MSRTRVRPGRELRRRAGRLVVRTAAAAIALAVAGTPGTPVANAAAPPAAGLVVVSGVATSGATASGDLTVTMTCPEGMTAVSVTGEVQGFDGATINALTPKGRQAVARATVVRETTARWSLRAKTRCVAATPDIEYVTHTWTITTGYGMHATCRWLGKELIGLGWATEGVARPEVVLPFTLPDPASGLIDTVDMNSYGNGDLGYRTQSATAVCADRGHGTQVAFRGVNTVSGPNHTSATCPDGKRANAVSLRLLRSGENGQLLRRLDIEPDGVTGSMDSVELDPKNTRGSGTGVYVLCVRS